MLGRLTKSTDRLGEIRTFAYDWFGDVVLAENSQARIVFQCDREADTIEEEVTVKGDIPVSRKKYTLLKEFGADVARRNTARISDFGIAIRFVYNPNGWLTGVTADQGLRMEISRDSRGRPAALTLGS